MKNAPTTPTTLNDYRPEVSDFVSRLNRAGISVVAVNDGEERHDASGLTPEQVAELVTAVDVATPVVARDDWPKRRSVLLVLGNATGEPAADWTECPQLNDVCDDHAEAWDSREQPTVTR